MEQITGSKKYQNGVRIFWTEEGEERTDFFTYEELVEQRIKSSQSSVWSDNRADNDALGARSF
ncbi:MAG TPA: hypothetical protein VHN82_02310, partial [Methanoregula sp.]|nr:hypothetical protein [Methanoregula sp.]